MIRTQAERQAFSDASVARLAQPDFTPIQGMRGIVFTRSLARICPFCSATFYVYAPDPLPAVPYWRVGIVEPEPEPGRGQRATCGHPLCRSAEESHQLRRDPAYLRACGARLGADAEPMPRRGRLSDIQEAS